MLNDKQLNDENRSTLQKTLFRIIFGTDTRAGRNFDILLIIAILGSILALVLDSLSAVSSKYNGLLGNAEWFFTILFTAEYLTRLYCSPKPWNYARSFYGIVDLLAFLPTYIAMFIPGASYLLVVRALRMLRIFRILKLFRYISEANVLMRSLINARRKIFIFLFGVLILTTLFGALMYVVEGEQHGFTSIPKGIYWAIITITTVGYGDITPHTPLGQAIAALITLTGYSIIAIPTGIITAELSQEIQRERSILRCDNCHLAGHENDAKFCKRCGAQLTNGDMDNLPH